MKKTLLIILAVNILFLIVFFPLNSEANQTNYINPQKYCITYSVVISSDNSKVTSLEIWMPLPKDYDSQRNITIKNIEPEEYLISNDREEKTKIIYWREKNLSKGYLKITFLEQLEYTSYEIKSSIDVKNFTPYNKEYENYTRNITSEKLIESDNPVIVNKAKEIVGSEENPYKKANMIYDWIIKNIYWKEVEEIQGALFALENGFGECGDYSALFCALCRSVGIPARPIVGFLLEGKGQYHVWTEFYTEDAGWVPVDVNLGDDVNSKYYFGNLDNRRFICSKGFNIFLKPQIKVNPVSLFQLPYWWYHGSGDLKYEYKFEFTAVPND